LSVLILKPSSDKLLWPLVAMSHQLLVREVVPRKILSL
jgi:hypothetical protein